MRTSHETTVPRSALAAFLLLTAPLAPAIGAEPAPAQPARPAASAPGGEMYASLRVPLLSELFAATPVALIDGQESITFRDLGDALATTHEKREGGSKAGTANFTKVLNRVISARLVAMEAREMEMDQVEEVKKEIEGFKAINLRETLQARVTKDVKPTPADVDAIYRDLVREWKLASLFFEKQDDARQATADLKAGKSFDEVAKRVVAEKKAKGGSESKFVSRDGLLPVVRDTATAAKIGVPTAPLRVASGWAILRIDEVRYPEDAKRRAEAEKIALSRAQTKALEEHYDGLKKRYLQLDEKLLKSLDYHAPRPGYRSYEKDQRALARIAGEKPITVAEFTRELEGRFFHGIETGIKEKSVNVQKWDVIQTMAYKRIFTKEAKAQGIDRSEEYLSAIREYSNSVLFAAFVNKVVVPDVKVGEDEARKYWQEHQGDFTYPALYKLDSIPFLDTKQGEAALKKLQAGTEFKFLKANSDGQVPEGERTLRLEGNTITAKSLPPELTAALAGAKRGDYRLYSSPKGHCYVVQVIDTTPAEVQPFEKAKDAILKTLFAEAVDRAVDEWAGKLRKAHEVKVFITQVGS